MKKIILYLLVVIPFAGNAQKPVLHAGSIFPDYTIHPVINTPIKQLNPSTYTDKILIINFWGTWCPPCLPEMDSLAVLKQRNKHDIEVLAVSNENVERLQNYLKRKPSSLLLASDTASYLYRMFGFDYVGQCAIVDRKHRIIAIVQTDSVNQALINKILRGEPIQSTAETGKKELAADSKVFNVDAASLFSISIRPYISGATSMGKEYTGTPLEGRRKTFINACPEILYKSSAGIESDKQVAYENTTKKEVCNFKDTTKLFCYDVLVRQAMTDNLNAIMLNSLNMGLPIKGRIEKRMIPVYVLRKKTGDSLYIALSSTAKSSYSYNGTGFEGKGIALKVFVDYLSNELDLPVYDDTGLANKYDITTENALRTKEDIIAATAKLGLVLEKGEKEMKVLVLYKTTLTN